MNHVEPTAAPMPAAARRHPGRLYLIVGMLVALAGVAVYVVQLQARILVTPWYMPVLATLGLILILFALLQSQTVWRWIATCSFALFAGAQWMLLMIAMSTPPYAGSTTAGTAFPDFSTTLADGSPLTRADLQDGKNTLLLFFRGRW